MNVDRKSQPLDIVERAPHYNVGQYEAIDVIEDWDLGFNDGNAVKYISRHRHKGSPIQDIKKALWYLQRHLMNLEKVEERRLRKLKPTRALAAVLNLTVKKPAKRSSKS